MYSSQDTFVHLLSVFNAIFRGFWTSWTFSYLVWVQLPFYSNCASSLLCKDWDYKSTREVRACWFERIKMVAAMVVDKCAVISNTCTFMLCWCSQDWSTRGLIYYSPVKPWCILPAKTFLSKGFCASICSMQEAWCVYKGWLWNLLQSIICCSQLCCAVKSAASVTPCLGISVQ